MTLKEAKKLIGQNVYWADMHPDVIPDSIIMEEIAHNYATLRYSITPRADGRYPGSRYTTYKHIHALVEAVKVNEKERK